MEKKKKIIIAVCVIVVLLLILALILLFANKEYTITFDSKGGTEVASQTVKKNGTVTKPEDPTKEGYTFLGWYISETSITKYNFESKVDKDLTLIAKWEGMNKEITDISIITEKTEINVDEELSLTAKLMAGDEEVENGELVWSSSDEKIATVDQNGKVKALKAGTIKITVTVNGVKSEIEITVKEKKKDSQTSNSTNTENTTTNTSKSNTGSSSTGTTKPSTGTTTKPSTEEPTKPSGGSTTEPEKVITYSYQWEKVESSVAGQYMLYIVSSEGKKVAGTATITTISGNSTTASIPASGKMYVKDAIASVSNVKGTD